MRWKQTLDRLELRYNDWIKIYTHGEMGMNDVNNIMQDLYPGPYLVVEKYRSDRMAIGFMLEFSDPVEETAWLLRWS